MYSTNVILSWENKIKRQESECKLIAINMTAVFITVLLNLEIYKMIKPLCDRYLQVTERFCLCSE